MNKRQQIRQFSLSSFSFHSFSYLWSTTVRKQMLLLLKCQQQPNAVSPCLRHSPLFLSSYRHFILLHHPKKKGEDSLIRYLEREREHIHITCIAVYCFNCSILSLVIAVHPLLCLLQKLNFIMGMYVKEKTIYVGLGSIQDFRHPLGCIPHG